MLNYTYVSLLTVGAGKNLYHVNSLFEQYGPVVRLGPNNLGFIDGAAWKDIYGHRPGGHIEKAWPSYRQSSKGPITILNADQKEHALLRKWIAPTFSDRGMREQESMIGRYVDLLLQRLQEKAQEGQVALNMRDWYSFTTFDIIGKLAFSNDFGCLESSEYHPWVKMVNFMTQENLILGELRRSGLGFFAKWVSKSGILKKSTKHANWTMKKLAKRIEAGKLPDLMEELLHNKDGIDLSLEDLHANAMLFIVAGSETTATLLSGVTYLLLTHPDVLKKVVEEVRSSFATADEITLTSVSKLSYMFACLNEAFRCYPPVPGPIPRTVVKGTAIIAGHVVPEGTTLSTWQYSMYHSKNNFALPYEFHPERFLGDPRFSGDKLEVLQPFSIGPRDCVGRNLAYAEMRLILSRILFTFDLKIADDSRDWFQGQKVFTLWQKPNLNVYLTPVVTA
ncbi:cytochrome P450 [Xylariales sp. PMI_506]|nr:cytochrome P450 [Xylariales sp. PMI_506]